MLHTLNGHLAACFICLILDMFQHEAGCFGPCVLQPYNIPISIDIMLVLVTILVVITCTFEHDQYTLCFHAGTS